MTRASALVLAAAALLSAAALPLIFSCAPPALRLQIDPSSEPLLPAGDPARASYRQAIITFGDDQVFVIALEAGDVFRHDVLETLQRLGESIARLDGVRSVKSLASVVDFHWDDERQWVDVGSFIEKVPKDPAALAALRRRALGNPLFLRSLVSPDGATAAINVSFHPMSDRELIERDLDGKIGALVAAEQAPGRRFHLAGRPHLKTHVYWAMLSDLARLIPACLVAIALALAALTGSWRTAVLPLLGVLLATLWTFAAMALSGRPLTILTVLLAPTLIAIGSAYGVHVLFRLAEEGTSRGAPGDKIRRTMRAMRTPILISGLTTMIGFAALMLTDVPAVFELGSFSLLGVVFITGVTLAVLPAALRSVHSLSEASINTPRQIDALLRGMARLATRSPTSVIAAWVAVTIASAISIPSLVIDTDYLSFFPAESPIRRDFEAINRLLAGATPLFVVLDASKPGAFRDPTVLGAVGRAQRTIDVLPGVTHTASFLDSLRRLNRAFSEDDPVQEQVPDTRAGITELLFLIPKRDLGRLSNVDQSRLNLVVRTGEVGSASIRRLSTGIEQALREAELPSGISTDVTGNAVLLSRSADAVAAAQPRSVLAAAIAILVLVAATLRSLRLGLVAMLPNIVPVVIFFGLLGAGIAPLSLPTSLIAAIALGIAIDATAHYLVRYRSERDAGMTPEEAVQHCNIVVGRPIATAALTLVVGFGIVAFSSFAPLQQFGLLTSAVMGICLATDLLLLPAVLVRLRL